MLAPRTVAALAAALGLALLLASCVPSPTVPTVGTGTSTAAPSATAAPLGDGVLTIGTLLPKSGAVAFLGPAMIAGVDVAVREINEAGGVGGVPVVIVHGDSGDATGKTPETTLATLLEKKVDVIIGPSSSVIAYRLLPDLADAGVPIISPAATLPELSSADDSEYFFRTIPSYPQQGLALAAAISEKGPAKVALVYSDDLSGNSLSTVLDGRLHELGSTLVTAQAVAANATSYDAVLAAVKDAGPDAVVLATQGGATAQTKALITGLTSAGFGGAKLWLTSQNLADYSQALGAGLLNSVNGVLGGASPSLAFIVRLKKENSGLVTYSYALEAYDATILAALAAGIARDDAGEAIAEALAGATRGGITCASYGECVEVLQTDADIDYGGLSGPLNWDANGDITSAYYGVHRYSAINKYAWVSNVLVVE